MSGWNHARAALALGAALAIAGSAAAEEDAVLPSTAQGPSLKVSGFADFGYTKWYTAGKSWAPLIPPQGAFSVGNMNIYFDGQLSEKARSLIEIRFTYLPNGAIMQPVDVTGDGIPDVLQTNGTTQVLDPTKQGVATSVWSGIIVERAYAEYSFSELLTLRAGQFLTPYGIWNVDHGSPAIIGTSRPFIINNQLFPERQVGLELYGAGWLGNTKLGWHLTASNGRMDGDPQTDRTTVPPWTDYDGKPAFGGRVFVESEAFGELRAGVSFFTGRYTSAIRGYDLATGAFTELIPIQFDERSFAGDVRWRFRQLLVQAEGIYQTVEYTQNSQRTPGFKNGRSGAYVLTAWELPHHVMPYLIGQFYNQDHSDASWQVWGWDAGLRWSVQPNLILKASYGRYVLPNAPAGSVYKDPLSGIAFQVAWAF